MQYIWGDIFNIKMYQIAKFKKDNQWYKHINMAL